MSGGRRRFRFGVQLTPSDGEEARRMAHEAESLGYASIVVPDHASSNLAPFPLLAVLAENTRSIKIGTLVLAAGLRDAGVLAEDAAAIHYLSDGRLELGLGTGWLRADFDRLGVPLPSARERVGRLAAAVARIKARPAAERPHLVIGGGSKNVLTMAAREADTVHVNVPLTSGELTRKLGAEATEERFRARVGWISKAACGREDAPELGVSPSLCGIKPGSPAALTARLGRALDLSPEDASRSPMLLVGTVASVTEALLERRELLGLSYIVIPWSAARAMRPVVEELNGR
ncbi:LLM class flavin-dependent oxidoreductase [Nonomuraea sp. NPDC046802]|uniref:LLM class flavin-dependent oxidoreductase n=1 Tax=Nonomuraea sp. NPDC046802 TaxID=3154919 RepID=UPI0033C34330